MSGAKFICSTANTPSVAIRSFVGEVGSFQRTIYRHDYSLPPLQPTVLDALLKEGYRLWYRQDWTSLQVRITESFPEE